MNPLTNRSPDMRKIPAAPTQRLDIAMARMLQENQELQPQMLLLFEQSALMQREKHLAFVRAGFTDDQAFVLATK